MGSSSAYCGSEAEFALARDAAARGHELLAKIDASKLPPHEREELAEQQAGPDVGERLESEDPVRRLDAGRKDRVLAQDLVDDAADRLVYQRDPELVEVGHDRIMPGGEVA